MWFWFSVIALLCWSGSDLFSKIGCREANDKTAHLKMVMAVGIVMGLHACFEIFVNGVEINMQIIMTYLPVSLLYILSMAMGYIGLRYIELSISSPDALRYIRYPSSLATGFHVSFTCELDKTVGVTVVAYGRVAPVAAVYLLYTYLLFCLLYAFTAYWYGFPATSLLSVYVVAELPTVAILL